MRALFLFNFAEKIQKRLEVSDKEFEKYKFAVVVMTRIRALVDSPELTLNLDDFRPPLNQRECPIMFVTIPTIIIIKIKLMIIGWW